MQAHVPSNKLKRREIRMKLITGYMEDPALRQKLNLLTQETFGFDFEDWFTEGYWEGDYIPYSYEDKETLIANVSVNRMEFIQNGQERHYIQLGTVMTKKEFRNQGYARKLMERVLADYAENCDGIYLFANLEALGFYEKLGFSRGTEYRYVLKETARAEAQSQAAKQKAADCFCPVELLEPSHKQRYQETVRHSAVNAALEQRNKYSLQMFYTRNLEEVCYSPKLDCYAVLEKQGEVLYLKSLICKKRIPLEEVLACIQGNYHSLLLGFSPCSEDASLFIPQLYDGEEDYRFFYYGEKLRSIQQEALFFPLLSHA